MCSDGRVRAGSVSVHIYTSAALAVCAYQCLSMSERIPLCVGCTISHREGMRGLAES